MDKLYWNEKLTLTEKMQCNISLSLSGTQRMYEKRLKKYIESGKIIVEKEEMPVYLL